MCKPAIFIGGTKAAIRRFPDLARRDAGWQLEKVQAGEEPVDWKPMPSVGSGVKEIRIHQPYEHRVIYVARFPEAVYILSAFEKKTERTPQRYIDAARYAYAEVKKKRQQRSWVSL